jgi:hypothetical protein
MRASRLLPVRRAFAILLDEHLRHGQHPELPEARWKPWTNIDFAASVGASPNSVANWRNQRAPIPPDDIIPILDALFGDSPQFAVHRRDLKDSWERAKGIKLADADGDIERDDDWSFLSRTRTSDLAAVTLRQPKRANPAGCYYLNCSVEFGPLFMEDEHGRTVMVGLHDAKLQIDCDGSGFQIAQNSMLGLRAPNAHVEPGVDSVSVHGPMINGVLDGNPIGDDYIAMLEPGSPGDGPVSLTLTTLSRAVQFSYAREADQPLVPDSDKPNRVAILNILFGEALPRDTANRLLLARASMRRKDQQ